MAVKRPKGKLQKKYERYARKAKYGKSWDQIRQLVYKRDGFRCRGCGKAKGDSGVKKLNAHHIILLKVSQTNDIRNLITLCDECHMLVEAKGLRLLKAGGHKTDVVRMTYRWLNERKVLTRKILEG